MTTQRWRRQQAETKRTDAFKHPCVFNSVILIEGGIYKMLAIISNIGTLKASIYLVTSLPEFLKITAKCTLLINIYIFYLT